MKKLIGVQAASLPTTSERSRLMARVRRSGTKPELLLRTALHQIGLRYRAKSGIGLPGTPDIAFRGIKLAIFVDGCFWHGCPEHGTVPKTNTPFWVAKISRNRLRDKKVDESLKRLGWKVIRIWEHQALGKENPVVRRIKRLSSLQAVRSRGRTKG